MKVEQEGVEVTETVITTDEILIKGIKREGDDDEQKLVETKHNIVKRAKRARKA